MTVWIRRAAWGAFAALALLVVLGGLYLAAAFGLAALAVNRGFAPDPAGVRIGVSSNGVHANLHLPVRGDGVDWTRTFPPEDFAIMPADAETISFGWGHREFYLVTRTWADLRPALAADAIFGFGGTALHVAYWPPLPASYRIVYTRISAADYARLVDFVRATVAPGPDGGPRRIEGHSYYGNDAFYEAGGRYHMFRTCNEWVREALAAAGVRTSLWSPFPDPLLRQVERAGTG